MFGMPRCGGWLPSSLSLSLSLSLSVSLSLSLSLALVLALALILSLSLSLALVLALALLLSLSLSLSLSGSRATHLLLAHGANRTGIFIKNHFVGAVGFPWLVHSVMFRYFPGFCFFRHLWMRMFVLGAPKNPETLRLWCWNFQNVCVLGAYVWWNFQGICGAPEHTGFSRMSGFLSCTGFSNGFLCRAWC